MSRGPRRLIIAAVLAAGVAAGCGSGATAPVNVAQETAAQTGLMGTPVASGTTATDFALRDQDGRLVRLSSERGKPVLVTFLYTHCPDVCPLIAENLNTALRRLGSARDDVRVIAVSVDPRNDTPEAVRQFVAEHHLLPQFRYLTGTAEELAPVWQAYNVLVEPRSSLEQLSHGSFTLLVDEKGNPVAYYDPQTPAGTFAHDLRTELRAAA